MEVTPGNHKTIAGKGKDSLTESNDTQYEVFLLFKPLLDFKISKQ
jgi:hypothetical protein